MKARGRLVGPAARRLEQFSSSLEQDVRLSGEDIRGSVAHARMLGRTGIIPSDEADAIVAGLESIGRDLLVNELRLRSELEDIHLNVEALLVERIGPAGNKLHTARSRNDQVALDLHLYAIGAAAEVSAAAEKLQIALVDRAEEHRDTIMPGYTHLQSAQPVTLGFHLLAYFFMLERDQQRLRDARARASLSPLGAAALAGTSFPIDPHGVATELGLAGVYDNAADAVSDRDFAVELVAALALVMVHLSRLAEDVVLWTSPQFGFAELPDCLATGSSIMPQKKNPDPAELIRGKAGRVWGDLLSLGMMQKGLPLTYNRDLQEVKRPLFDAVDTARDCLMMAADVIQGVVFVPSVMLAAAATGFATATDLADWLVAVAGVPFREAHQVVGRVVQHCAGQGIGLEQLTTEDLAAIDPRFSAQALACLTVRGAVGRRRSPGGTSPQRVAEQLATARSLLAHSSLDHSGSSNPNSEP